MYVIVKLTEKEADAILGAINEHLAGGTEHCRDIGVFLTTQVFNAADRAADKIAAALVQMNKKKGGRDAESSDY